MSGPGTGWDMGDGGTWEMMLLMGCVFAYQ